MKIEYANRIESPLGNIILVSDGIALTGLYWEDQVRFPVKYDYETGMEKQAERERLAAEAEARAAEEAERLAAEAEEGVQEDTIVEFEPEAEAEEAEEADAEPIIEWTDELEVFDQAKAWLDLYFQGKDPGETPKLSPQGGLIQKRTWIKIQKIKRGDTSNYGLLAAQMVQVRGMAPSPLQVANAVANNPINIMIPNHRVLGVPMKNCQYAGGDERKEALLKLEGIRLENGIRPVKI